MKTSMNGLFLAMLFFLCSSKTFCASQHEEIQSNKELLTVNLPVLLHDVPVNQQPSDFVAANVVVYDNLDKNVTTNPDKDEAVFKNEESYPEPENGVDLGSTIQSLISYPESAIDKGIEGVVKVLCTIEKNGAVSSVVILNDIGGDCAEEVCRVVRSVKFKPAMQNGYARSCNLIIPVVFELTEGRN